MKKVLILMAERTGTGHKSSANAIEKKLKEYGVDTKQLDCFQTMGKLGQKMEDSYINLTTKHPLIWKIAHSFSQIFPNIVHNYIYHHCKKEMYRQITKFKPDLIISVHCMFTKAISKLLLKNNLKIPFYINVIDMVNPPKIWQDKSADLVFLPTEKAKQAYIKLGFDEQKLIVSGFPIREDIKKLTQPKKITDKCNILMVNPSINLNKNIKMLYNVLKLPNVNVTFICGRDIRLYQKLIELQNKNDNFKNVKIVGFINNMNEYLANAHIILTKAGPNMLLEATRSGCAVVVTGHIPGQEAKNFQYITENNYGIKCENPKKLYNTVYNLINSNYINTCFNNTMSFNCNDGAIIIAENICSRLKIL